MGKGMAVVLTAVLAVVTVDVCWCSNDGKPNVEMANSADQKSESWSGWLHGMYKEAFSSEQVEPRDTARNLMESAGNTAAKTKDTVNSAASGASKLTTEKTGEAANKAYESASGLKDVASDKADRVIKMVGESEGGETFEKAMEYGKQKASGAYDSTKQKMNTASEKAYEAKERMADALSSGTGCAVDAYDLHADWPSDDEDDAVENGRIRGSGISSSKFDHHTERMERKAHEVASNPAGDLTEHMIEGVDYGRSRISNSYSQAKENINAGIDKAAEKGGNAKEAVGKAIEHGQESITHMKGEAKDKVHTASDKVKDEMVHMKGETKDKVHTASVKVKGEVGDEMRTFDESRKKVGETLESAKEKMTEEAKASYETAKEKFSEATGAVGDKMRKDKAELSFPLQI
ncbi:uncharacterized protein [Euphorbia lathyris]|uniref:uncharacterized protein isoform X2 n=1 Tax=Euphorbia lathyris TaxID=212925 RepID=UPI00331309C1